LHAHLISGHMAAEEFKKTFVGEYKYLYTTLSTQYTFDLFY